MLKLPVIFYITKRICILHVTQSILFIVTMDLVYAIVLKLRSQIPLSETVLFFFFLFILQAIGEGTGEVNGTTFLPPAQKKSITVLSHVPLSSFLFVVLVV